jgi:DNA polymerase III subunit delta
MPVASLPAVTRKLRERPSGAVLFLHGTEEYLREEALKELVSLVLDPATRDFNFDQIRGGDAVPETLASILATPPMMAEYRVVVLREAQSLTPKAREVVERILASATPGIILFVVASIPPSTKAKFYDTLRSRALTVEFPSVDPMELPGWLVERARSVHDVEIEMDAARALSAAIGAELGPLASELQKAASYVGDRNRITLDDIRAVGGYIPRVDRWAWFDKIGERRFAEALADLPDLLDSGEGGVGLLIGITSHLLRLGLVVDGGRQALERQLGNQAWLANRLAPQGRKWTAAQIDQALADALRADRLLKSASLGDRQVLEEFLLRLEFGSPAAPVQARRAGAGGSVA